MHKEYRYRKHIRLFNKILPITLFILGGALILLSFILLFFPDNETLEIFITLLILALIIIGEGIIIGYFFKKLATTVITLNDEGIKYKNHKQEIFIRYEEITNVSHPSIKYTGGWIKIESNQNPIRLTVVVERIHEFIFDLKQQLDKRELSHTYNEKRLFSFFKTATFSDLSWNRLYRIFFIYLGLQIVIPFITIILALLNKSPLGAFLKTINIFLPLFVYLVIETILGKKMTNLVSNDQFTVVNNDIALENSYYKKGFIFGLITFIAISIFIIIS